MIINESYFSDKNNEISVNDIDAKIYTKNVIHHHICIEFNLEKCINDDFLTKIAESNNKTHSENEELVKTIFKNFELLYNKISKMTYFKVSEIFMSFTTHSYGSDTPEHRKRGSLYKINNMTTYYHPPIIKSLYNRIYIDITFDIDTNDISYISRLFNLAIIIMKYAPVYLSKEMCSDRHIKIPCIYILLPDDYGFFNRFTFNDTNWIIKDDGDIELYFYIMYKYIIENGKNINFDISVLDKISHHTLKRHNRRIEKQNKLKDEQK